MDQGKSDANDGGAPPTNDTQPTKNHVQHPLPPGGNPANQEDRDPHTTQPPTPSAHIKQDGKIPITKLDRSQEHNSTRVALSLPAIGQRSPLDKYKATADEAPRPNPHRFVLQRLGLSKETFDARVTAELDDLLRVLRSKKQLSSLTTGVSFSSIPHILTKEDFLTLFRATSVPKSGPCLASTNGPLI